jgi:hypothetical protein
MLGHIAIALVALLAASGSIRLSHDNIAVRLYNELAIAYLYRSLSVFKYLYGCIDLISLVKSMLHPFNHLC